MNKEISAEGLALCADCEKGRIENSLVPYCDENKAPYSSHCNHVPYGNTPYVRSLKEKVGRYEEMLRGMDQSSELAERLRKDMESARSRLKQIEKRPKWREFFIAQGRKK